MDWTQPQGAPLKVSLLQGNVPQSLKWDPRRLPLSIDTYLSPGPGPSGDAHRAAGNRDPAVFQ
jgi:apolipoprotein N-acyltransferase